MRKNKTIPLIIIMVIVFLGLYCVVSYNYFYAHYYGICLENASCRIPKRMWNPEEDQVYVSDHMFSIVGKEQDYIIYGGQLEKYNGEDESHNPFFSELDPDFLEYDNLGSLEKTIKNNSDVLNRVIKNGEYNRPSFDQYYIEGQPNELFEGYDTYIVVMNEEDMRFIEIILYRDPFSLTEKEKYDIFKYCNYTGP